MKKLVFVLVVLALTAIAACAAPILPPISQWTWEFEADYVFTAPGDPVADTIHAMGTQPPYLARQKPIAFCPMTYPWGDKSYNFVPGTCKLSEPVLVKAMALTPTPAPTLAPSP